jgi:AraC-like DNA-binding protein
MIPPSVSPDDLLRALGRPFFGDELFDRLDDTVYFVKDAQARYVAVNQTLVRRCRRAAKSDLVGRTAREIFPAPLGAGYEEQDRRVLADGAAIAGRLELHLYPDGRQGWCLTWKEPLRDAKGGIAGLVGISRDLASGANPGADLPALSAALAYAHERLDRPLRVGELAKRAGLSPFQFDRRLRALFGLTAGQYLTRARIERACDLLARDSAPISEVAQVCGYSDQAAFTRQFHRSVGLTPRAYRLAAAERKGKPRRGR